MSGGAGVTCLPSSLPRNCLWFLLLYWPYLLVVSLAFVQYSLLALYLVGGGGTPFLPLLEPTKSLISFLFPLNYLVVFRVVNIY